VSETTKAVIVSTGAGPRGDLRDVLYFCPFKLTLPWFQQVQVPEGTCGGGNRGIKMNFGGCFNRCRSPRGPAGVGLFAAFGKGKDTPFQQVQVPEGTCGGSK